MKKKKLQYKLFIYRKHSKYFISEMVSKYYILYMLSPLLEPTSSPLPKNYQLGGGNIANKYKISLQQNVFLAMKISEEIFFIAKNTALVTKYEFLH